MRASGASELENFDIFTVQKLPFLAIFSLLKLKGGASPVRPPGSATEP